MRWLLPPSPSAQLPPRRPPAHALALALALAVSGARPSQCRAVHCSRPPRPPCRRVPSTRLRLVRSAAAAAAALMMMIAAAAALPHDQR